MNTMKIKVTLLIVLLFLFLIFSLIYLLKNSNKQSENKINLYPSSEITPTEKTTVILDGDGFRPKEITISIGTEIFWENNSGDLATVDSNPHPMHTDHPELNLGEFKNGEKLNLTFTKPGVFKYHNHYNPEQEGTITVK